MFVYFGFSDDVCVLSAIGTAAVINAQFTMSEGTNKQSTGLTPRGSDRDIMKDLKQMNIGSQKTIDSDSETIVPHVPSGCSLCHIPHSKLTLPVNGKMQKCAICK